MPEPTPATDFLQVLRDHKGIIYQVAHAYCQDTEDRKDLVQDITLQLWRSFGSYTGAYQYSTWIYRIALNVAISRYRSERRRHKLKKELSRDIILAAEPLEPIPGHDPIAMLHEMISGLKPLDKALVLLYLDGKKYQEIADIMGISQTNVSTRMSRLKILLREKLPQSKF